MRANKTQHSLEKGLIAFTVRRPYMVSVFTAAVILMGLFSMSRLQRDLFPNVDFRTVFITTRFPGATVQDVELKLTVPIEEKLSEIGNLKRYYSISSSNISMISVEISQEISYAKFLQTRDKIREKIGELNGLLPDGSTTPIVENIDPTVFAIRTYVITSDYLSEQQLRKATDNLVDGIYSVRGVSGVVKSGYRNREYQVYGNLDKMNSEFITLSQIGAAIANFNVQRGGGSIRNASDKKDITTDNMISSLEDLGKVVIRSNFSEQRVEIDDIAEIYNNFAPRTQVTYGNQKNGIIIQIQKTSSADILRLGQSLDEKIAQIYANLRKEYGDQLEIELSSNMEREIRSLLGTTTNNAYQGFIIVLLTLWIFLRFEVAFWTAMGIPISVLATFIYLFLNGINISMPSLFGFITVIGIVVDDGIVVAENIFRRYEMGEDPETAAILGTKEMIPSILGATGTTIMMISPLLFMGDVPGQISMPIPIVIIMTLIFSTIEVTFSMPAHICHNLQKKEMRNEHLGRVPKARFMDKVMKKAEDIYAEILKVILKFRYLFLLALFFIFASSMALFGKLDFIFFSNKMVSILRVILEAEEGVLLQEMQSRVVEVEKKVKSIIKPEELFYIRSKIGSKSDNPTELIPEVENHAVITITLVPPSQRDTLAADLAKDIRQLLETDSKLNGLFKTKTVKLEEPGPPAGGDVVWRVVSNNGEILQETAKELENFIASQKGVFGVTNTGDTLKKELVVIPNRDRIAKLNINPDIIANTIDASYTGRIVSTIPGIDDTISIRTAIDDEYKNQKDMISKILIPVSTGTQILQIPLGSIAKFEERLIPASVNHLNGERTLTITASVDTTQATPLEVDTAIKTQFLPKYEGNLSVEIASAGAGEQMTTAFEDSAIAGKIGFVGIIFLLLLIFRSWTQTLMIFLIIPFSMMGVSLAFLIHQEALGFFSIIGILGLFGVSVNDAIVLMDHFNRKVDEKTVMNFATRAEINHYLAHISKERLRPIFLTSLTTIAGLTPSIYGWGGENVFVKSLVLAIGGGLFVATLVTLAFIPVVYSIFTTLHIKHLRKKERREQKRRKKLSAQGI